MFIAALFIWRKNLQDVSPSEIIRTQNIATENINQNYKNPYYLIKYLNTHITHKHTCVNSSEKCLGEIHIDLLRLVTFDEKNGIWRVWWKEILSFILHDYKLDIFIRREYLCSIFVKPLNT